MQKITEFLSKSLGVFQVLSSISLALIGVLLLFYSFGNIFQSPRQEMSTVLLSNLSLVVIAIAILDVAKYVIEEAVGSELDNPKDVRRSLTKFVVIIFVAISLETIVSIFLVNKKDYSLLVYPTALLFTNILLLIGLGIYQRFSVDVEKKSQKTKTEKSLNVNKK